MLKVWGRKSSSNVQALMWCIGELDLAYDRVDVGFTYGGNDTPDYLAMNPNGTVPMLIDGDNPPIWETGAILRYLAGSYGSDGFWPKSPVARARVDMWAEWAKINVALTFTAPIFWRVVRTAPSKRDPSAIASALETLNHFLSIADRQLATNQFIAGPNFTLADIQFGHCLFRYFDIAIMRTEFANITRYYESLSARRSFHHHVMISYDELRVCD